VYVYIKLPPRVPSSKVADISHGASLGGSTLCNNRLHQQLRFTVRYTHNGSNLYATQATASITSSSLSVVLGAATHIAGRLYKAVDVDGSSWIVGELSHPQSSLVDCCSFSGGKCSA
jgi:hypothetical protein